MMGSFDDGGQLAVLATCAIATGGFLWLLRRRWLKTEFEEETAQLDPVKWRCATTEAPWGPRVDASMASCSGGVALVGGFSGRRHSDCWWTCDGREWVNWVTDPDAPFQRRMQHTALSRQSGELWIAGGQGAGWNMLNDVWQVLPHSDGKWERVQKAGPWKPRCDFSIAELDDGQIIVTGGVAGRRMLDDIVWIRSGSLEADSVIRKETAPWGARRSLCLVALPGGRALVFGGSRSSSDSNGDDEPCNDVWCWASGKWHDLGAAPWPARSAAAACRTQHGSIVLCGGAAAKGDILQDVWVLDDRGGIPTAADWRCVHHQGPFEARSRHVLAWSEQLPGLVLAGGITREGKYLNDVWTCRL